MHHGGLVISEKIITVFTKICIVRGKKPRVHPVKGQARVRTTFNVLCKAVLYLKEAPF